MVSNTELKADIDILHELILNMGTDLPTKIDSVKDLLERHVTNLESTVEDINKQVSDNYNSIVELNKKVIHLENENASLKQIVHENTKDNTNRSNAATQDRKLVTELEEEIEDRTKCNKHIIAAIYNWIGSCVKTSKKHLSLRTHPQSTTNKYS